MTWFERSKPPALPDLLPALVRVGSLSGWGRLLDLTPRRARLVTRTDWEAGEEGSLEFELEGELHRLRARAVRSELEPDDYRVVELAFVEPGETERLEAAVLRLLARKPG